MPRYFPANSLESPRFTGVRTFMRLPFVQTTAEVQFDAHGDVWDEYFGHKYTHGTPIRRAMEEGLLDGRRVVQVGMRGPLYEPHDIQQARDFGFTVLVADDVRALGLAGVVQAIREVVGTRPTFLSFDIDF